MALTKSEARTSRIIFYAAAIVAVLYGLLFLSLPEWALELSQDPGAPKDAGWLRLERGVPYRDSSGGLACGNPAR
jgi:hypothetical protein